MEIADWTARWREGRIGFHEGKTNTFLAHHVERLGPAPKHVLVPLCGKTEDLVFLASRGHVVIGIEAVEEAVEAFFREHDEKPEIRQVAPHVRSYSSAGITIFVADVFACTKAIVGEVDALYDRAALIALPADVRRRYVAHLRALLAPRSTALVVTLDYDQAKMSPPPHAVGEAELRELYAGARIQAVDGRPEAGRFRDAGVEAVETCFAIELE